MKILTKTAAIVLFALVFLPALIVNAQSGDTIETIAGIGNVGFQDGREASFHMPSDVLVLQSGEIIVADTFNNLLRHVNINGETSTFVGFIPDFFPLGFHRDGEKNSAGLNNPTSLAICNLGWIHLAEPTNNSIRVIAYNNIFTFVGWGEAGFSDGPRIMSAFNSPSAIAFGPDGYLYVADTLNHVIRRVSPEWYTTTIAGVPLVFGYSNGQAGAALFDSPTGIAVASDGRIFVADTGNNVIRVIESGNVRTLAGRRMLSDCGDYTIGGFSDGIGIGALFNQPRGLAMWGSNLIVADSANHSIRMITPAGVVSTVFGTEFTGYDPGTLHFPMGVYVHENRLYIADSGNNKIRMILLRN